MGKKQHGGAPAGEAMTYSDMDFCVRQALRTNMGDDGYYALGMTYVYPGAVVYQRDGQFFRRSYSMQDGKCQFDAPEEPVEQTWTRPGGVSADTEDASDMGDMNEGEEEDMGEEDQHGLRDQGKEGQEGQVASEALAQEATGFLGTSVLVAEGEGDRPVLPDVTVIRAGVTLNRREYPARTLERDAKEVFEGAPCFITNHTPEQKTVANMVGVWRNVRTGGDGTAKADLHVFPSQRQAVETVLEAYRELGPERVGPSIYTPAQFAASTTPGVVTCERLARSPITSIDLVVNPAAGSDIGAGAVGEGLEDEEETMGKEFIQKLTPATMRGISSESLRALCEGVTAEQVREWNPEHADAIMAALAPEPAAPAASEAVQPVPDVAALVAQQVQSQMALLQSSQLLEQTIARENLGELAVDNLRLRFGGRAFDPAELQTELARQRDMLGRQNPNRPNVAGGSVQVGAEALDRARGRLYASCMRNERVEVGGQVMEPFHHITEAILAFNPEMAVRRATEPLDFAREALSMFTWGGGPLRLASEATITTGQFNEAWADVLNRVLLRAYADPEMNNWRPLVSDFISFNDLTNSYKFISLGELGTAPVVLEGGTYTETTPANDRQQSLTIAKRGYLLPLTWESILRDDISVLARIPNDLGRAWGWTVYDAVWGVFTANAGAGVQMGYDTTNLYAAGHNNTGTLSFSAANLETQRRLVALQTDPDSGKRKRLRARYLMYADTYMDQAIWEVLQSEYKITVSAAEINLPNYVRGFLGLEPVPVIYPDDSQTRWELAANPADAQGLVVGFLGGRQTPDILVADQETVGSRFTADKVVYKMRGTVGATVVDHRPFARGNA